jgi:thioredoxin 1
MYFILIETLAIFGLTTTAMATDQLMKTDLSNSDGILKLNDNTVNIAINKFPFFVLDCYVPWCEPCKTLGTALNELASKMRGQVTFGQIDIENNSVTARKYNITSYPTLLIFKNGILIDSQEGYGSKSELVDLLQVDNPGLNTGNIELAASHQPPITPFSSDSTQMTTLVPIKDLMAYKIPR